MRYHFNGCGFTVSYNEQDSSDFSYDWPCSTVEGKGFVSFESNGDLIDAGGSAMQGDGSDWLAFIEDLKAYGQPKFERDLRKKAS